VVTGQPKKAVTTSDIRITGDTASAKIARPGQPDTTLYFRKEGGAWKVCAPAGDSTTATPSAANSITYEISGTAPGPLSVSYAGSEGKKVEVTVSSLPWSVTVTPAPKFVSIFAVSPSIESKADITLTLKRGTEVLKTCRGGAPCLMPFPS
jgi:hypothetical protein